MRKLLLGAALAALSVGSAGAQQTFNELYTSIPTTPDIAVTASATTEVFVPGGVATWVAVKNDCSRTLYFDLRGAPNTVTGRAYGLRLGSLESYSGPFRVHSIGVSPASGDTTACTFTLQLGQ